VKAPKASALEVALLRSNLLNEFAAEWSKSHELTNNNNFGITGETSFDYRLTEIGGLEQKILGGIKAGITEFIYPFENTKDFKNFMDKYRENTVIHGIQFHCLSTIYEVFDLIIAK
jgi:ATP-dependent Lon protease